MRMFLAVLAMFMPWPLHRWILTSGLRFSIHPASRIGFSFVLPRRLVMEENSRIGHLNVVKGLERVQLAAHATIGNLNWITGFPLGASRHFAHQPERQPELILETQAAIANRHLIDCTGRVTMGKFSTLGGFASQILSHSVDLVESRQTSGPVSIGEYCFIGTNCVLLANSRLPSYSVLGAKSLLNKAFEETYSLYAGVPAHKVKEMPVEARYFTRQKGFIW